MEKIKLDPLFSINSNYLGTEPKNDGKNKVQVKEKQNIRENGKTR